MARRRSPSQLLAGVMIAVLAVGCVNQPVDESEFAEAEANGVVAAPMTAEEAEQLVDGKQARKQNKRKKRRRQRQAQAELADQQDANGTTAAPAGGTGGTTNVATDGGDSGAQAPAATAQFVEVAAFNDRPGDASGEAPDYGDIDRVVIQSNGTVARVSVVFAGDLPPALADGEVQGVGVDFYRSGGRESDYQLFADGGYKGWRAFLHGPDGVVPFEGVFKVGGPVMVFEVPWAALGGKEAAGLTVFSDWSQKRTLLNAVGNDRAPNSGKATVRPARV